ncbi:MAG: DUF2459 domain-containing protein [Gemmataceae bacterium]|nr:DUF2459 domain-containing protein [Gemmataceae bacterium]
MRQYLLGVADTRGVKARERNQTRIACHANSQPSPAGRPQHCSLLPAIHSRSLLLPFHRSGGSIPVNNDFEPTADGVEIMLTATEIHADLVLSIRNETMDWSKHLLPSDFAGDVSGATHMSIGWGNKEFYVDTPTWADVKVGTVFRALFWPSETRMHVRMSNREDIPSDARKTKISQEQYRRLVDHILSSFQRDETGQFLLIKGGARDTNDAFYYGLGFLSRLQYMQLLGWARTASHWGKNGLVHPTPKNGVALLDRCPNSMNVASCEATHSVTASRGIAAQFIRFAYSTVRGSEKRECHPWKEYLSDSGLRTKDEYCPCQLIAFRLSRRASRRILSWPRLVWYLRIPRGWGTPIWATRWTFSANYRTNPSRSSSLRRPLPCAGRRLMATSRQMSTSNGFGPSSSRFVACCATTAASSWNWAEPGTPAERDQCCRMNC